MTIDPRRGSAIQSKDDRPVNDHGSRAASREDFIADIPLDLATRAHAGTSHVPERRAAQERDEYASTLAADHAALFALANTPEKVDLLTTEFARYRAGYRTRFFARLSASSRCMSTMITGGSNFPVARQRKASARADKATTEQLEFRERALAAIRKKLCPELRPIMAGDADALDRLTVKLAKLEGLQEVMTAVNKAIRKHARAGAGAQITALVELGISEPRARDLLAPDFVGRIGFADYHLANNGAEIRRTRARIAELTTAKATDDAEIDGRLARVVVATADNRVRVYFPGKPATEVIARLKTAAFRWTPSLGCWQAFINTRSVATARAEAGADD